MDVLIHGIVGFILVPIYNWIKKGLGLQDKAAAWVFTIFAMLIAFPITLLTGKLSGLSLDLSNPFLFLKSVVQGFLVVVGSAETFYMLTKEYLSKEGSDGTAKRKSKD